MTTALNRQKDFPPLPVAATGLPGGSTAPGDAAAGGDPLEAVLEKRDRLTKLVGLVEKLRRPGLNGLIGEILCESYPPEDVAHVLSAVENVDALDRGEEAIPSLVDLAKQPLDESEILIGSNSCRYLECGAVLLLAAVAGGGKSHLAAQAAVCWSCGRPAFGLPAVRPLRTVTFQAENPPNDSRAIARNMIEGLNLTTDERAAVHMNTRQLWLPGCTGDAFLEKVHATLTAWPADLVFLDPLGGFASGDLVRPEVVQAFCRSGLSSIAVKHHCALFVCHHVPKPNAQRDASRMGAYDFQYAGAGSADLVANWPRCVLTMQALARGEFLLRAAKRRPPWRDDEGGQAWEIGLRHSDAGIWETFGVDPETGRTGRPKSPDPATFKDGVLSLLRESGPMPKTLLSDRVRHKVTGSRDGARAVLEFLCANGSLVVWRGIGRGGCSMIGLPSQRPEPEPAKDGDK